MAALRSSTSEPTFLQKSHVVGVITVKDDRRADWSLLSGPRFATKIRFHMQQRFAGVGHDAKTTSISRTGFGAPVAMPMRMEAIYERPRDYDLEHQGNDEDIAFYLRLIERWHPKRILELASGSGRVTIPLARSAAMSSAEVVGLERCGPMLDEAHRKRASLAMEARARLSFIEGDMRRWSSPHPFELVIAPCSSLAHLLTLDDQIAAWRCAFENLCVGGRFVVDLTMPNLAAFADSLQTPPRTLLEVDIDARDSETGTRLLRYKTTRYLPHQQRAEIRFLYDRFPEDHPIDRYVSDFDGHVYYPRELELLFRITGFSIERWFGDYAMRPLSRTSRQMIAVGVKNPR